MLDETDSGLDIDALKVVSEGVNRYAAKGDRGVLLITPTRRILRYITPGRARLRRRQDRRGGRPGARRGARGRGLRQVRQGQRLGHLVGLEDPPSTERRKRA